MSELVLGIPVVMKNGKEKSIFYIREINEEAQTCVLSSYSGLSNKETSLNSVREAEDIELMIGYRLEQK